MILVAAVKHALDTSVESPIRSFPCACLVAVLYPLFPAVCLLFARKKGNYGGKIAASFSPKQGACLVHGHGRQCLLHEGAAVTSGVKYLLRTDVMYA